METCTSRYFRYIRTFYILFAQDIPNPPYLKLPVKRKVAVQRCGFTTMNTEPAAVFSFDGLSKAAVRFLVWTREQGYEALCGWKNLGDRSRRRRIISAPKDTPCLPSIADDNSLCMQVLCGCVQARSSLSPLTFLTTRRKFKMSNHASPWHPYGRKKARQRATRYRKLFGMGA